MVNVVIYLLASIGVAVQVYGAMTGNLWWSPGGGLPTIGLVGVLLMTLGTAWSAVKGSSAAWFVFIGALFCWAFYVPGLGSLLGQMQEALAEGRLSYASPDVYVPLLAPILLAVATYVSLMNGPMGKKHG
jgi:hypothetical protein